MELFEWKTAIILFIVVAVLSVLIRGYVLSNLDTTTSFLITALVPLIFIFYFIAWVLMCNSGKVELLFKLIIETL